MNIISGGKPPWTEADRLDADLMARVRDQDDHSAFADLLRRITPFIDRVLHRCLPRGEICDARATVQSRMWFKRHRYHEGKGPVRAWVSRISLNYARDWGRRRARAPRQAADLDPAAFEDRQPGPVAIAVAADAMAAFTRVVAETLKTASPLERTCWLLRLKAIPYADIARHLQRPMGTVASAVRRFGSQVAKALRAKDPRQEMTMPDHINSTTAQTLLDELQSELAALENPDDTDNLPINPETGEHVSPRDILASLPEFPQLLAKIVGTGLSLDQLRDLIAFLCAGR